ncbi:hypothetical protein KIW84_063464 [Lathyrus oleraceus]|uniref:Cation/H(+) antiporter central domain-containing protein n=1 Tax=Pisum sativum TaxID=3888 RepID=A0A9D4WA42_PEA|nr:hypothetical protein KIW84_063464 [Pisum sativum]
MLTDAYGWVMFTLLIPYSTRGGKPYLSVISTLMFIVFCFAVFADVVLELSADFVSGILCPVYFAGFGFRLNLPFLLKQKNAGLMFLVMLLLCIPKVLSSVIVTFFFGMPARDGVAIGLLLNTKDFGSIYFHGYDACYYSNDCNGFSLDQCNIQTKIPIHAIAIKDRAKTEMDNSNSTIGGAEATNYGSQLEFESITNAFEKLVEQYNAIRFDISSVVSSYTTIHEDIYNVAEEKRASLILLPFHKDYSTIEDAPEIIHNEHCEINKNVLQKAPCSVGIFVGRGLGSLLEIKLRIIMIFIGGPDDREALSIAWRMAGHPGTQLHVVRINLLEKEVHSNTGEEIPTLLNDIDKPGYDLYIVGQGSGKNSVIFSRLLEWCDHPELGVIGDILASTSFGTQSSVLIVQQYLVGRKRVMRKCHEVKTGTENL